MQPLPVTPKFPTRSGETLQFFTSFGRFLMSFINTLEMLFFSVLSNTGSKVALPTTAKAFITSYGTADSISVSHSKVLPVCLPVSLSLS